MLYEVITLGFLDLIIRSMTLVLMHIVITSYSIHYTKLYETFVKQGFYLEHIFIKPEYHKFGIGRLMIDHAKRISKNTGINNMLIFVYLRIMYAIRSYYGRFEKWGTSKGMGSFTTF